MAKSVGWGVVLILPGGFLLFFAYLFARAVYQRRQQARSQSTPGGPVGLFGILAEIRLADLVREARAAFELGAFSSGS
jgi:hypothetical protein